MEDCVVIYAPIGKDASLIHSLLQRHAIESIICTAPAQVAEILLGGVGALFIADEALSPALIKLLDAYISNQPTWSDLPIVVLTKKEFDTVFNKRRYLGLGNLTLLERPVNSVTLVSAAAAALRARRRQYEMRAIDRRKDEFLAMLAHELRNPLAPISAASEILKAPSLEQDVVRKTSDIVSRQVKHMTGLIDDLLDVSRVSRGLIHLESNAIDVNEIVINAVEQVRPLMESRQHVFNIEHPTRDAYVLGDQKRLVQILANLLNNAAKYTPERGEILLSITVDNAHVVFTVTDNGIGMEPDVLNHVFEMFSQAKRTSDRFQGGLGIGLALVRSLVALHRGTVSAFSEGLGRGSKLVVKLPLIIELPSIQPNSAAAPAVTTAASQMLMIVDDNVDAAKTLAMVLELHGYQICVEHSAQAAIERVRVARPVACLLDIGLPDMDGSSLAKILRNLPETANSVLIAITGYGQEEDRKKTSDAGFHHHMVKPVDIGKLLTVLSTL